MLCYMVLAVILVYQASVIEGLGGILSKRQSAETNEEDIAPYVEFLRGRDGRDGRDGVPGPRGSPGVKGDTGATGLQGLPGPSGGGVTYIRWGNTTCPSTPGTETVYSGRAAGSHYNHQGGTSDYLCLPSTPEYSAYRPGVQGYAPIYGAEYETYGQPPLSGVNDHNVPCAVCRSSKRYSLLIIPARVSCPDTWTKEYEGYLMTEHKTHHRTAAVCVNKNPAVVRGEAANTNGALFYHTEAVCNGIDCPPYDPEKELTCCVCTK